MCMHIPLPYFESMSYENSSLQGMELSVKIQYIYLLVVGFWGSNTGKWVSTYNTLK